ncbi:hypothetical protein [Verrucomicrobium sp. BvORR106]|uniref:hypothetical protein n=1 Tax=Verrucomicrobium sp. BvORR106 TaxID=1403819 RepID=UPI0005719356|nr:hypothetical protein [Verrucomicrobium sp. BvORR106]
MLWKLLSGLAAVALLVGVWSSYNNRVSLEEELKQSKRAVENNKAVKAEFPKVTAQKELKTKQLEEQKKALDDVKLEKTKVDGDTELKTKEGELVKQNLEDVNKQLTQLEDQIKKVGDVKKLMASVQEETEKKKAVDASIANQQQQLALSDEKIGKVQAEITRFQDVEKRQRSGVVEPGFTARVAQAFQEFGFVVLNKGNASGMFADAMLDVKRGRTVVAKLKVRDVEQGLSVADLVPGSLAPGESIRSGDLVVAAREVPKPVAAPSAPAPAADPSQQPAAPAPMAPAGADPFGGAPGAAPAPAPMAPGGADPFAPAPGAAPAAPAAPMAPANADPFAPPAGTTPAAPATMDPFAPKP